ncbi:hypothetical protein CDAR_612521 [Caerostris darwini]|uniref:Uncharacterized protein n=1 Tax=Caerostris darwini TaxID=1538125 RepID=A0AAV4SEI2_9ARAC|nr:hypothetical protein CDAR_612521 [Caerostris darwini]
MRSNYFWGGEKRGAKGICVMLMVLTFSTCLDVLQMLLEAVRCEVHGVRAPHRAHRAGDAGPGPRVPPALLRVRGVRPAAPEGRPVRHTQRSTLLQAGLREGDGRHADRHQRYLFPHSLQHVIPIIFSSQHTILRSISLSQSICD